MYLNIKWKKLKHEPSQKIRKKCLRIMELDQLNLRRGKSNLEFSKLLIMSNNIYKYNENTKKQRCK